MTSRAAAVLSVLALAGAAGCAPRIWIDDHGNQVNLPVIEGPLSTDPAEPAFCIDGFRSTFDGGGAPLHKYGGLDGAVGQITSATSFRSMRSIVGDPRSAGSCDLLVTVGLSGGDAAGTRCCDFSVRRPSAGTPLWHAVSCAQVPLPFLARLLHSSFRPGNRYYDLYAGGKASAPVAAAAGPSAAASVPVAAPAARSDVDELPPARPAAKAYAVVVGVERYREKLPNAEFASADARLAAQYFQRALGVPEENTALLVDDRAAKSDFEKYFERWLPNRVEAGDTVYVYYSGHGAPNPAKGDSYLVPYDGDPTYIDQTGFAVKRLFDDLAKLPAKHVYVAMDSCFSGAGGRSVIAKGARPLVTTVEAGVPSKVTVLSASAGDQISNGYDKKGHGLFTYFLLKGLKEKGDIRAAFDYAKPEVARAARREFNADQEPQWREGR